MSVEYPVKVVAIPQYLGEHEEQFAFAYTIHITNESDQRITLRNRHWVITDEDGEVEEVRVGKFFEIELEDGSPERLEEMSAKLLANTVIEDFRVELVQ